MYHPRRPTLREMVPMLMLAADGGGWLVSKEEPPPPTWKKTERTNERTVANEGDRTSTRISMERHAVGFDLRIESLNWMYCAIERRAGMTPRDGPIKS
ncbi:hypothetical protein K0M31_018387 [Melipona bicolor]|uniref:Uncharacterized protein n=1 Tax=Melipona bicolor TaxID=60889 RepID=A0AA40G360_9HYME|nr:hypothetical protein K0M31_018387 [Melipona bicolor]